LGNKSIMIICSKCKEEKDENEFYFRKDSNKLRKECKECFLESNRKRNATPEGKEKKRISGQKWYAKPGTKERIKQSTIKYRKTSKYKETKNKYQNKKRKTDPCYKLRNIVSRRICHGFKKNGGSKQGNSLLKCLSYSMQELKQHIESLWESWMNWGNYGPYDPNKRTWQIDHIKPHSSFHYENMDCEEFRKCWSLSNLRPLEAMVNIKKGKKDV